MAQDNAYRLFFNFRWPTTLTYERITNISKATGDSDHVTLRLSFSQRQRTSESSRTDVGRRCPFVDGDLRLRLLSSKRLGGCLGRASRPSRVDRGVLVGMIDEERCEHIGCHGCRTVLYAGAGRHVDVCW